MVTREDYIALEREILKLLEFSTTFDSPIVFLERYLRIFGFDEKEKSLIYDQISASAYKCCLVALKQPWYLEATPS